MAVARPQRDPAGQLDGHRHVAPLYARRYIAADAYYPGHGGHVLRTVHDPWGSGHNVIFAGGSDVDSVATAVDHLLDALVVHGKDVHLPALLDVVIGAALLADHPDLAIDPDEAFIQSQMDEAYKMLETSATAASPILGRACAYYHATGKVGWAEFSSGWPSSCTRTFKRGAPNTAALSMDADFSAACDDPCWIWLLRPVFA
ncbi:MAG: hypothetical protein R2856_23155 [Caldilineaceae bacterium]